MKKHFRGWYYRCQSDTQTLAIIPSIHKTLGNTFYNIQIITGTNINKTVFEIDIYRLTFRGDHTLDDGRSVFKGVFADHDDIAVFRIRVENTA